MSESNKVLVSWMMGFAWGFAGAILLGVYGHIVFETSRHVWFFQ